MNEPADFQGDALDVIRSSGNEYIKYARGLKTKKGRRESGAFLVEGEKCVKELVSFMPGSIQSVIIADDRYGGIAGEAELKGARIYRVTESVLESVCDCKTPQGIAAVAAQPRHGEIYSGFIVMLDDAQDPQNVGTIIRTADAAGCSCVVLSPESADCFSPKAVRASMGSIFHIPVIKAELTGYIEKLMSLGYDIACGHLKGDIDFALDHNKTCLVIGNESRGVSEDIARVSTKLVKIPIYGKAESLNAAVAAGILIYKIRT
ncbi:MAG: TrmH family RNA methyltransferase [Burkholderiales bacterium]